MILGYWLDKPGYDWLFFPGYGWLYFTVPNKISNYFLRFSTEYKKIHNLSVISNDWYEYVEFGSSDSFELKLQRLGYSRETAKYIKENKVKFIKGRFLKYDLLIKCNYENVKNETEIIKMNNPRAFT